MTWQIYIPIEAFDKLISKILCQSCALFLGQMIESSSSGEIDHVGKSMCQRKTILGNSKRGGIIINSFMAKWRGEIISHRAVGERSARLQYDSRLHR